MNERRHHGALACGLALAALLALAPAHARASNITPHFGSDADLGNGMLLASAIVFGATDLGFIIGGRPMPLWLSIVQIGIAGTLVPISALASSDSVETRVSAAASMVWFNAHAIHDIAVYPEWRRERERERERARQFGFAIEPRTQGGVMHVYGRF